MEIRVLLTQTNQANLIINYSEFCKVKTDVVQLLNYISLIIRCLCCSYMIWKYVTFVHKCLHHRIALPLVFSNYFSMNNVVHDYKTRQSNLLHPHSTSTQNGKCCILNKGCTLWDNLPNHLQNHMSIHQFKTLLKRYLQECYYVDMN